MQGGRGRQCKEGRGRQCKGEKGMQGTRGGARQCKGAGAGSVSVCVGGGG